MNSIKKSKPELIEENEEDTCVVCFRAAERPIYSIGECDHPVCFECSTRMRVLCTQNECPICRKEMAKVVFICEIKPFNTIDYRTMKIERRYHIYFENDRVMRAFDELLDHICPICDGGPKLKTFASLREHMKRAHERFYCDLCVDNLKIFTSERRCYDRTQLAAHRRKGDANDKSHRGHPQCEFCDTRFVDKDELFRHLRRDHFFCHFCDADGLHQYYNEYDDLRVHFRTKHFLCEEGDCKNERFTSVYRTKVDYQGHTMSAHSHLMNKNQARQARTLDIAFTVSQNRPGTHGGPATSERGGRGGGRGSRGGGGGAGGGRRPQGDYEAQEAAAAMLPPSNINQPIADINCQENFPSLKGELNKAGVDGQSSRSIAQMIAQNNRFTIKQGQTSALEEEFPSLMSYSSKNGLPVSTSVQLTVQNPVMSSNSKKETNVSVKYNSVGGGNGLGKGGNTGGKGGGGGKVTPYVGNISHSSNITVQHGSASTDDFPSLCAPASGGFLPQPLWAIGPSSKPKKETNVSQKVNRPVSAGGNANASKQKDADFRKADFPSLSASAESKQHMTNHFSTSTVPSKKDSIIEQDSSGKIDKKSKKTTLFGVGVENKPVNGTTKKNMQNKGSKKKPLMLNNVYDDSSDEDGLKQNFTAYKKGDYESVAPQQGSNIKMISSVPERKKSELKIGPLKPPPVFDSDGDFPSLGGLGATIESLSQQNRGPNSNTNNKKGKKQTGWTGAVQGKKRSNAPPGFSNKNKIQSQVSSDSTMTFTSSLGQEFQISPTLDRGPTPPINYSYSLPPSFEFRNQALITAIHSACLEHSETFLEFKKISNGFRNDDISGKEYYVECKNILGKEYFLNVLPELLALLPDIQKQQAILGVYKNSDGRQMGDIFNPCLDCRQVCVNEDLGSHVCERTGDEVLEESTKAVSRKHNGPKKRVH